MPPVISDLLTYLLPPAIILGLIGWKLVMRIFKRNYAKRSSDVSADIWTPVEEPAQPRETRCVCDAHATHPLPSTGKSWLDTIPGMPWLNRLQGQPDRLEIITKRKDVPPMVCEQCRDLAVELLSAEHAVIRQEHAQHNARIRQQLLTLEHGGLARQLAEVIAKAQAKGSGGQ